MFPFFLVHPLFIMALLARGEIILMVAGRVAPIDAWLAHRGNVSGCRRRRMWLMAIAAFRDRLSLFRSVRHIIVWGDLLPAWRHIARDRPSEFIEGPVTFQTHVLGEFGGGGTATPQAQCQRENKYFDIHESKSCFYHFPHPPNSVWKCRPETFKLENLRTRLSIPSLQ
jgi:hypothetical protein